MLGGIGAQLGDGNQSGMKEEVSQEQMRLIGRVASLDERRRLILLVDPAQLLDRAETKALSKLDRTAGEKVAKAS